MHITQVLTVCVSYLAHNELSHFIMKSDVSSLPEAVVVFPSLDSSNLDSVFVVRHGVISSIIRVDTSYCGRQQL